MSEGFPMRVEALAAILVLTLLMPTAAAHGANTFSFIMRSASIQPSEAQVVQNDTIVFYNVVDYNRTIQIDKDGDGTYDEGCETAPSNTSSIKDECAVWMNPNKWEPGRYQVDIFSNGTLWDSLNFTLAYDLHEDGGPPTGYEFNKGSGESGSEVGVLENGLRNAAILLFIASAIVWLARRGGDE